MAWRLRNSEFQEKKGLGNKHGLRAIVEAGMPTGVLAYIGKIPVGWCAVAPRKDYVRLGGSRVLSPVDDRLVWSVSCFYVARERRRMGISVCLLVAGVQYARRLGAKIVEGYPLDISKPQPDVFVWTGLASAFHRAGFQEVARRSATRPIMRCELRK